MVQWTLVSPPEECYCSLCFVCAETYGQQWYDCCAIFQLPRSSTLIFFSFSESQAGTEGRIFHDDSRIQKQQQGTLADFQTKKVTKRF
jgi:hypothetical protein